MPEEVPAFEVPLQRAIDWALLNSPDPDYYRRIQKESESRLAQARANAGLKADFYMQFDSRRREQISVPPIAVR